MSMVLAMAAVTGGMIASQRQRALAEAREENARLAIQDERNRMARDVHDILGHSLTVITVKAELAVRLMEVSPERAKVEVEDLERLARDALADVRQAVAGFREMSLPAELARARSSLAAAGIEADLPTAADAVPTDLRELCAWTLREGVTNVIRHSAATSCRVTLDERGITIADNGTGPQPGVPGTGLVGLKERAEAVGARLETRPVPPHGFELSVTASTGPAARGRRPTREGGGMTIRLLLADDQALVRGALATLLGLEPDMEVVAEVGTGDEVVAAARSSNPDVALIDVEMPGLDGIAATAALHEALPGVRVLIVTTFGRPGFLRRALQAGASGFVVKDTPARQLAEAVRRVHSGLRVVDPALAADSLAGGESPLTARETEVLVAASEGGSVADIARHVSLSEGTVRNHLSSAIGKTMARNRADAVRIADEYGWL